MDIDIREAAIEDKEEIFKLVEKFSTSFKTERILFDESIKNIIDKKSAEYFRKVL